MPAQRRFLGVLAAGAACGRDCSSSGVRTDEITGVIGAVTSAGAGGSGAGSGREPVSEPSTAASRGPRRAGRADGVRLSASRA
ncbi:hypothetical protein ACFSVJ_11835 [Prauserella oleivorans]